MLTHLENTKMIRFLPKGSLRFWGVSIMKAMSPLVLMKTMWQAHLIKKTCIKEKFYQKGLVVGMEMNAIF
jgi:hypothetical protein